MDVDERLLIQRQVIDFLCGRDDSSGVGKEHLKLAVDIAKSCCRQTCLPEVPVLFDDEGMMSLHLSEDDKQTFNTLFGERWPVVEAVFSLRDALFDGVEKPQRPSFFKEGANAVFSLLEYGGKEGKEKLCSKMNEKQRQEYKIYSVQRGVYNEVREGVDNVLYLKAQEWERENAQYDFLSLPRGMARDRYDTRRGKMLFDPNAPSDPNVGGREPS